MTHSYSPVSGYAWNPLRHYRNIACPCGSQRKAKRCHGQFDTMPAHEVELAKLYLRSLSAAGLIEWRDGFAPDPEADK